MTTEKMKGKKSESHFDYLFKLTEKASVTFWKGWKENLGIFAPF